MELLSTNRLRQSEGSLSASSGSALRVV